jgi:hypothetical protein
MTIRSSLKLAAISIRPPSVATASAGQVVVLHGGYAPLRYVHRCGNVSLG